MTGFAALYQDTETGEYIDRDVLISQFADVHDAALAVDLRLRMGSLIEAEPEIEFECEIEFPGTVVPLRIEQPALALPYAEAA